MIHILIGRGKNCTCYDCPVLYGGECPSTPENDLLDKIELVVLKELEGEYISKSRIGKAIESIRPLVRKYYKIDNKTFDNHFYCWLPLLFVITSNLHKKTVHANASSYDVRRRYMQAKSFILWNIDKKLKEIK